LMSAFKAAPTFQRDRCGHMDTMAKRLRFLPGAPSQALSKVPSHG